MPDIIVRSGAKPVESVLPLADAGAIGGGLNRYRAGEKEIG